MGLLRRIGDVLALSEGENFSNFVSDLWAVEDTSETLAARAIGVNTDIGELRVRNDVSALTSSESENRKEAHRMHALIVFYRQVPSGEETGRRIGFVRRIGAVLVLD